MATERQILANRLNALRSRGPKTEEGRAASRRNALKHGLTARSLIIEGEDPDLFETIRTELFIGYGPHGVLEEQLIDMMAGILWRLRRVPALEAAAISWMRQCHRNRLLPEVPTRQGDSLGHAAENSSDQDTSSETSKQNLGRAVFHMVRDGDILDKLNRYETQLLNRLARVMGELEHRREQQRAPIAIPPLAVE